MTTTSSNDTATNATSQAKVANGTEPTYFDGARFVPLPMGRRERLPEKSSRKLHDSSVLAATSTVKVVPKTPSPKSSGGFDFFWYMGVCPRLVYGPLSMTSSI